VLPGKHSTPAHNALLISKQQRAGTHGHQLHTQSSNNRVCMYACSKNRVCYLCMQQQAVAYNLSCECWQCLMLRCTIILHLEVLCSHLQDKKLDKKQCTQCAFAQVLNIT
jgi:hypothetical protein